MRILISVYVLKTFYVFLWPLFFSLFIYSLEISEYFLIYRTSTIYPTLLLQRAFPFPFLYHLLIPRERNLGILFFFFLPGKNPRSTRTILVFDYSYSIETRGAEIIWSRARPRDYHKEHGLIRWRVTKSSDYIITWRRTRQRTKQRWDQYDAFSSSIHDSPRIVTHTWNSFTMIEYGCEMPLKSFFHTLKKEINY